LFHSHLFSNSLAAGRMAAPFLVRPFQMYDLVAAVCPLPSTHFVEVYNARGLGVRAILDADGRADLGRQLVARVPALDLHAAPCRTLFHATIARGRVAVPSHSDAGILRQSDTTSKVAEAWHRRLARAFPLACPEFGLPTLVHAPSLDAASPAASAHLVPTASSSASSSSALPAPPTSLAVCLNRTRIASCMRHLLTRAQNLFNARAFLHWVWTL
jgi:hypothetical protein